MTANEVAQIFLVVDGVDSFPETAVTTSWLSALEWADTETITKEQFLVERS